MKRIRSETGAGFTLMELLVVITLIAVLATMVLAGASGIMKRVKRDQIRHFLAELDAGLENFKIDNGIYPLNPPTPSKSLLSDADAKEGAEILYQYLSGDFDLDGTVDENKDTKMYVERLDWWSNDPESQGKAPSLQRSYPSGDRFQVIDPLGSPVRYLAAPPGYSPSDRDSMGLRNPTFDLWSIAGADVPESGQIRPADPAWLTNWGAN